MMATDISKGLLPLLLLWSSACSLVVVINTLTKKHIYLYTANLSFKYFLVTVFQHNWFSLQCFISFKNPILRREPQDQQFCQGHPEHKKAADGQFTFGPVLLLWAKPCTNVKVRWETQSSGREWLGAKLCVLGVEANHVPYREMFQTWQNPEWFCLGHFYFLIK